MKQRKTFQGICAFLCMLVLILDGKTALEGGVQGLELCLKTIVPALFPFFTLSILLTGTLAGGSFSILQPIAKFLEIPHGMESILISGFLGGYPAGAQSIALVYRRGDLSRSDAQRMLAFCSNAGPSFLFGIVGPQFTSKGTVWILWGIHIVSAFLVALCFPRETEKACKSNCGADITITDAMRSALGSTACVCGWVLLFRILITFLKRWCLWLLPTQGQVAVSGLLELSNGCIELHAIADERLRFLLCAAMLAFGGICVTMQTESVCGGLSLRFYLAGKLLQSLFSVLLSLGFAYKLWLPSLLILLIPIGKRANLKNKSSIRQTVGV